MATIHYQVEPSITLIPNKVLTSPPSQKFLIPLQKVQILSNSFTNGANLIVTLKFQWSYKEA